VKKGTDSVPIENRGKSGNDSAGIAGGMEEKESGDFSRGGGGENGSSSWTPLYYRSQEEKLVPRPGRTNVLVASSAPRERKTSVTIFRGGNGPNLEILIQSPEEGPHELGKSGCALLAEAGYLHQGERRHIRQRGGIRMSPAAPRGGSGGEWKKRSTCTMCKSEKGKVLMIASGIHGRDPV